VYVSRGGSTYHRTARCWAFEWGQHRASNAFMNNYAIQQISRLHALGMERTPCLACYFPESGAMARATG
jgi:hypothetical protein